MNTRYGQPFVYLYICIFSPSNSRSNSSLLSFIRASFFFTQRAISPVRPLKFIYLRHLRLELNIVGENEDRKTDVLDYAYLLDCAPFLEKLEIHVGLAFQNLRLLVNFDL